MEFRLSAKNVLSAFVLTLFGSGIGVAFAAEPEKATPFGESGDFPDAVVGLPKQGEAEGKFRETFFYFVAKSKTEN